MGKKGGTSVEESMFLFECLQVFIVANWLSKTICMLANEHILLPNTLNKYVQYMSLVSSLWCRKRPPMSTILKRKNHVPLTLVVKETLSCSSSLKVGLIAMNIAVDGNNKHRRILMETSHATHLMLRPLC